LPTLTVTGFSFVPGPTATTFPFWGFSFAESGIIIPDAVFVSASRGSIKTLSASSLIFNLLILLYFF